jgi:hypothetical protein
LYTCLALLTGCHVQDCAAAVLGARTPMFTGSLSNPQGLVNYRIASGKTVVD